MGDRDSRIDLIKGLAIVAVVVEHAVSPSLQAAVWSPFHIRQAVTVFVILSAMLWSRRLGSIGPLYPVGWWSRWWNRLGVPFLVAFVFSATVATLRWVGQGIVPPVGWLTLVGQLPFGGPGNYYITVLVQLVVALPLLYAWHRRSPRTFLAAVVLLDVGFELACLTLSVDPYVYAAGLPRFLVAIALGFVFADSDGQVMKAPVVIASSVVAMVYLLAFQVLGWTVPFIRPEWQPENLFAASYALVLVALGLRFLPATNSATSAWLARVGMASYHIFLVQMLYFSFWPRFGRFSLPLDLLIPLVVGWLAYKADCRIRKVASAPVLAEEMVTP